MTSMVDRQATDGSAGVTPRDAVARLYPLMKRGVADGLHTQPVTDQQARAYLSAALRGEDAACRGMGARVALKALVVAYRDLCARVAHEEGDAFAEEAALKLLLVKKPAREEGARI